MTHMLGLPVKFDPPGKWTPCEPYSDGRPRTCRACKGTNMKYRVHESSCGGWEDDEIRCFDCDHTYWVDGIDS